MTGSRQVLHAMPAHPPFCLKAVAARAWLGPSSACAPHLLVLQLCADAVQVLTAAAPKFNFHQWPCPLPHVAAVLLVQHVCNLAGPVHQRGLQPLYEVLVTCCFVRSDIVQLLSRHVQNCAPLPLVYCLSER
jgi:hypothetical protein